MDTFLDATRKVASGSRIVEHVNLLDPTELPLKDQLKYYQRLVSQFPNPTTRRRVIQALRWQVKRK